VEQKSVSRFALRWWWWKILPLRVSRLTEVRTFVSYLKLLLKLELGLQRHSLLDLYAFVSPLYDWVMC